MRLRRLLAILAAGLLFLAACGDDDDSGDDAAATTTTDAPADDTDDGGDGGDDDLDLPSGFTSEECEQFVEAYTAAATALTGSADFDELSEFYDDIADRVPEEIRSDFETFSDAFKNYAEAAEDAGIDFSDPASLTPQALQEVADEAQALSEGEVREASQNLEAWGEENCTP